MSQTDSVPFNSLPDRSPDEMFAAARTFRAQISTRRTVREFSDHPVAAEKEERAFYAGRAANEWFDALAPLGTDADKPFLETAPWLIAIFEQRHGRDENGDKVRYYYTKESVGLATGFLIAALHNAGLATLTHTPSPMGFLNSILERPAAEKPFLLLVVGHPSPTATAPSITRKEAGAYLNIRS